MINSIIIFLNLFFGLILTLNGQDLNHVNQQENVKNVIFLIGDGMGLSQLQAAIISSKKTLNIEKFPVVGLQKTSSANRFITGSGSSATALASGEKANNGTVGSNERGEKTVSILEIVKQSGLKSGIVVTNTIVHATPAGFFAHQPDRNMYEEIALDLLDSEIDVLIGGGRDHFIKRKDNRNLEKEMEQKGYLVRQDINGIKPDAGKFLAIVGDSHLPSVMDGRTPEQFYINENEEASISIPSEGRGDFLPDAVEVAIEILNHDNSAGFFLLVEGSQIDPACHAHDLNRSNAELLDFDKAVGVALDFAKKEGRTLVVVTGDHETGGLTILEGNYETGEVKGHFSTTGHTGIMLPVFSFGPGSEKFSGIFDNTGFKERFLQSYGLSAKILDFK